MNRSVSTAEVADRLEAEDLARARWYNFFSRWFLAPPDRQAIDLFVPAASAVAASAVPGSPEGRLQSAWRRFVAALAGASLESIRSAYDDTFITVGEAPVSLYASVYLAGFANERPLAEIRQWLAGQGIEANQSGLLTEDHLGLLCEVMAWLIIERGDAEPVAADAPQHFLFQRFIAPVCDEFCQRLAEAPDASVYRELGELFAAFSEIERQAFDIDR